MNIWCNEVPFENNTIVEGLLLCRLVLFCRHIVLIGSIRGKLDLRSDYGRFIPVLE